MTEPDNDTLSYTLSHSPSHLLHRAQQFAADRFEAIRKQGLTLRQFAVMAAVDEHEGCSQSDLVRVTGIDRSTLADMVQRMHTKGLVERRQDKLDARANAVYMTDTGRDAFNAALPLVREADGAILEALPKNRRRSFIAILALLADAADEEEVRAVMEAEDAKRMKRLAAREKKDLSKSAKKKAKKAKKSAKKQAEKDD